MDSPWHVEGFRPILNGIGLPVLSAFPSFAVGSNGTKISQRNSSNRHSAELGLGAPRSLS
jgi:hypothetical protein